MQFVNANSGDFAWIAAATKDNTTYQLVWTISAWSGGAVKGRAFGPTITHSGITGAKTIAGTFLQQFTTSGAGGSTSQAWINATGATAGTNNFTITRFSLRELITIAAPGDFYVDENFDYYVDENLDFYTF